MFNDGLVVLGWICIGYAAYQVSPLLALAVGGASLILVGVSRESTRLKQEARKYWLLMFWLGL